MASQKRTEYQLRRDRILIREKLIEGKLTHQEIADLINKRYEKEKISIQLSREMITYDINFLFEELEQDEIKGKDKLRKIQIMKLNYAEIETLEAWKRSQKVKTKETIKNKYLDENEEKEKEKEKNLKNIETTITKEKQVGNPQFLQIYLDIQDKIHKLNGLYIVDKELNDDGFEEEEIEITVPEIPSNSRD